MAERDDDTPRSHLETIIERCSTSRDRRRTTYRQMRQWFERGTDLGQAPALFNRIHSHVELMASMLYAPESARFWISVSPAERQALLPQLDLARDLFGQQWRNTGGDVDFATLVEWAHVYGTMLAKIIPGPGGPRWMPVEPAAFGVMLEHLPSLDRQPAFVHWYVITLPELRTKIRALPPAEQAEILSLAEQHASPGASAGVDAGLPGGMMGDVIVTSIGDPNNVQGYIDFGASNQDRPDVTEPLVELAEVWVRSEWAKAEAQDTVRFWDWKVTTCLQGRPLWAARNPVLPYLPKGPGGAPMEAEQPFVAIRPNQVLGYFWGRSEVFPLTRLQEVADQHLSDIRGMMARQLDPPFMVSGYQGPADALQALRSKGGAVPSQLPGSKLQPLVPSMPPQAFDLLTVFGQMFNEEGGIPEDLGTAQEDIRVQGQIVGTARKMGRIRKKALVVEDGLEVLATRMFHVQQRLDKTRYTSEDGTAFYLADLPADAVVKVSAHSASPVYAEQAIEKALVLFKAGAIDDASLIEILDPPFMELLKAKSAALMQGKAEMGERKLRIEEFKATRPARR